MPARSMLPGDAPGDAYVAAQIDGSGTIYLPNAYVRAQADLLLKAQRV